MLGIFAKEPRPGCVKTRLASHTSSAWAAEVAEALLLDSLDRLASIKADRVLAFAPESARDYFQHISQGRFGLQAQGEGELGHRMLGFLSWAAMAKGPLVVLVGTDSPTLPTPYVEQAFEDLEQGADVVIGPAHDGGYYLLGCRGAYRMLFEDIAWGTSQVLSQTITQIEQTRLGLAVLPPWYDVDSLDDWHLLRGHLAALRRAGHDPEVPRTECLLRAPGPRRGDA